MKNDKRSQRPLNGEFKTYVHVVPYQPPWKAKWTSNDTVIQKGSQTVVDSWRIAQGDFESFLIHRDGGHTTIQRIDLKNRLRVMVQESPQGLLTGTIFRGSAKSELIGRFSNGEADVVDEFNTVTGWRYDTKGKATRMEVPTDRAAQDVEILNETLKAGLDRFKLDNEARQKGAILPPFVRLPNPK